ncbi:MAG: hypothetical protein U0163_14380 [Gemmatimonadaceae bacterium]
MRVLSSLASALTLFAVVSCEKPKQAAQSGPNPFLSVSTLPYEAPAFDKIRDAHYQPAIEEGIRQQLAETSQIANDTAAPTFANTIEAMERSGALLTRVMRVFSGITQANTDDSLQAVQSIVAPKLAAHHDAIYLNATLFGRVQQLYDGRATAGWSDEQRRLVERYYRDFVRAGAKLPEADAGARARNEEESKLTTNYEHRLLAARTQRPPCFRLRRARRSQRRQERRRRGGKATGQAGKWYWHCRTPRNSQHSTRSPIAPGVSDCSRRRCSEGFRPIPTTHRPSSPHRYGAVAEGQAARLSDVGRIRPR